MQIFATKKQSSGKPVQPVKPKKPQPTREERIKSMRRRKIIIFVALVILFTAVMVELQLSGALVKAQAYVKNETKRITSDAGFKVDEILVAGREEINKDHLLDKLPIKRDMPIFWLDIKEAQNSLMKISWVKNVTISRRLPNKIFIDLDERKPAALWRHNDTVDLVDEEGVILDAEDLKAWEYLPLISGNGAVEKLPELLGFLDEEPLIREHLASAARIGDRRWDLLFDKGILIKLPESDVEFALRRLVKAEHEKSILSKNIKVIDLRKPERMVVELANSVENVSNSSGEKNTKQDQGKKAVKGVNDKE